MSITRWYKFTEDTAEIGTDSSGNLKDLTNVGGVTSVTDATYGKVAYFNGTSSYFTLPSADIPASMIGGSSRSISFWFKPDNSLTTNGGLVTYGNKVSNVQNGRRYALRFIESTNSLGIVYFNVTGTSIPANAITKGSWNYVTTVFNDTGNLSQIYVNGSLSVSGSKTVNTASGYDLYIGLYGEIGNEYLMGCMLDMRFYDSALDAAAILSLYNAGPEVANSLEAVMYTHIADLTWDPISGASTYAVTQDENSSGEIEIANSISETSLTAINLTPGTPYEFKIYTDSSPLVSDLSLSTSTPVVDSTSVDALLTRFSNNLVDLSESSESAIEDIDSTLRTVLDTGDVVETSLGETVFVSDSESLLIPSVGGNVLTPFDENAGTGQTTTILFDDTSTNIFTYNEATNELISDGSSFPVGSYTVVGKYKVTVSEI